MFQFPGFPYVHYVFMYVYRSITYGEFPHSDICGSMFICNSPQLFAACHVLHRRLVPRHPPYALLRLIVSSSVSQSLFYSIRTLLKNLVSVFPQQKYHIVNLCITLFDIFLIFSSFPFLWKNCMQLSRYKVFNRSWSGRLQWTRTTDPHLIRVVL